MNYNKLPQPEDHQDKGNLSKYVYAYYDTNHLLIKAILNMEQAIERLDRENLPLQIATIKSVFTEFLQPFKS